MRRKQPSIRCGRIDPRKRLAWPASLQLSLVLAAPAFSLARRKASASAPPPEGCCDLRGAEDVIDARELSRGMPCAGGSVLPPGSSSRRSVSANALAGDLDLQHFDFDDVARLYHLARILDEGLRHRRDVYQPILMHAPISTKAPNAATLVTEPSRIMPGFRSFSVSTPSLNTAALKVGRGSRPGFSSSRRMSVTVGKPKVSSTKPCGFTWRRTSALPISALMSLFVAARILRTTG